MGAADVYDKVINAVMSSTAGASGSTEAVLGSVIAGAAKASPAQQKLQADLVYVYDTSIDLNAKYGRKIGGLQYPGAQFEPISSWNALTGVLKRYSEIGTLVINSHSSEHGLQIGRTDLALPDAQQRLTGTGVKVTKEIRIEGCEFLRDPVNASFLFSGIAQRGAVLVGYNFSMVSKPSGFTTKVPLEEATAYLKKWKGYWIAPPPPEELARMQPPITLFLQWWIEQESFEPPDVKEFIKEVSPDEEHWLTREKLLPKPIATYADAQDFLTLEAQPSRQAYIVTVTNIPAVSLTDPR